ncbi:MAG: UPF0280 family protein [Candidatus Omnitrophota bacterium]
MKRFYRNWVKTKEFKKAHIVIEETDILFLSKKKLDLKFVNEKIYCLRQDIKNYIAIDKRFAVSLKPIAVELNAPPIIRLMGEAAHLANVGPMAAVAGAVAQLLAGDLLRRGYNEIIIENGGDIFLSKQRNDRFISIFAGGSKLSGKVILRIKAGQTPCGVCASSATFGHSLSFGNADSVVSLAKNAALADAVATAVCNLVRTSDDFDKAIKFAGKIAGVFGVLIILDDKLASWGAVEINFS